MTWFDPNSSATTADDVRISGYKNSTEILSGTKATTTATVGTCSYSVNKISTGSYVGSNYLLNFNENTTRIKNQNTYKFDWDADNASETEISSIIKYKFKDFSDGFSFTFDKAASSQVLVGTTTTITLEIQNGVATTDNYKIATTALKRNLTADEISYIKGDNGVDLMPNDDLSHVKSAYFNFLDQFTLSGNNVISVTSIDGVLIDGKVGNDKIVGNSGDDILIGGLGRDTLIGSASSDTFVFSGSVANFTGSITGSTLTVTAVSSGALAVGSVLTTSGKGAGLTISALGSNTTGGVGTYVLSSTLATAVASGTISAQLLDSGKTVATADVITDFAVGTDLIDLSGIINSTGGRLSIATSTTAGAIGSTATANSVWYTGGVLYADVSGDTVADFTIKLVGSPSLSSTDLIL